MGRECLCQFTLIFSRRMRIRDVVLMFSFVETIHENKALWIFCCWGRLHPQRIAHSSLLQGLKGSHLHCLDVLYCCRQEHIETAVSPFGSRALWMPPLSALAITRYPAEGLCWAFCLLRTCCRCDCKSLISHLGNPRPAGHTRPSTSFVRCHYSCCKFTW